MIGVVSGLLASLIISIFGGGDTIPQSSAPKSSYQHINLPSTGNENVNRPMEALGGGFKGH